MISNRRRTTQVFSSMVRILSSPGALGAIASLWTLLAGMTPAPAYAQPEIAVIGGAGVPGGTVAMVLELRGGAGGSGVAVMARVDFPEGAIETPAGGCSMAPRLQATHAFVEDMGAGFVALEIAPRSGAEDAPLGDGDLASCELQIRLGVAAGTVALVISSANLIDEAGAEIDVRTVDGVVQILGPTATATPRPTATATATPPPFSTPPPSSTPTPTPTPTDTPGPTFTVRSANGPDGCSIAPSGRPRLLDLVCWLAAPLSLWWARRRSTQPNCRVWTPNTSQI